MNTTAVSETGEPLSAYSQADLSVEEFNDLFLLGDEMSPLLPEDLADLPTSEVRRLCNRAFHEMDSEFPRIGARYDYETLLEELHNRPSA